MEFVTNQTEETGVLTLNGELTIQRAGEIKEILQKSIKSADKLEIRLENVADIDLSCLQLLCSAHRTALNLEKNITLVNGGSELYHQAVKYAGYDKSRGCPNNSQKNCLWKG